MVSILLGAAELSFSVDLSTGAFSLFATKKKRNLCHGKWNTPIEFS